ncbi:MAG: hypothetical protein ACE5IB_05010 [Candidatus Geothermarchaeales archaeon]
MKSYAVEGTVFWLVVSAIVMTVSSYSPEELTYFATAVPVVVLYLLVAYVCWDLRRWGFAAAIILALFTTLATFAFVPQEEQAIWQTFVDGAFLMVPQYILIFYAFRAYRELATG